MDGMLWMFGVKDAGQSLGESAYVPCPIGGSSFLDGLPVCCLLAYVYLQLPVYFQPCFVLTVGAWFELPAPLGLFDCGVHGLAYCRPPQFDVSWLLVVVFVADMIL
jgi:hypothetical protein